MIPENELSTLFVKLYLDEDVHKRLAQVLRLRGFDVISAYGLEHRQEEPTPLLAGISCEISSAVP
jgi:hypothetical protein